MQSDDRHFDLKIAESGDDLRSAQRLRYRVFVEELGAETPQVDHGAGLEVDLYDAVCDHLVLIDRRRDRSKLDHVIGVYRLLRDDVALTNGGYYSAAEYDLGPVLGSGRRVLELGRSCLDPAYRGGSAMFLLWNGVAEYVLRHRIDVMFGVASYHGTALEPISQSLSFLHHNHLAPPDMRVRARKGAYNSLNLMPSDAVNRRTAMMQTPALIKAYLRLGGFVGDGAYIDHSFNTVDICMLMDTERMSKKHRHIYTRGLEIA